MDEPDDPVSRLRHAALDRLHAIYGVTGQVKELMLNVKLGFTMPQQPFLNAADRPFDARTRIKIAALAARAHPVTSPHAARSLINRMVQSALDYEQELRPALPHRAAAVALSKLLKQMQDDVPLRAALRQYRGSDIYAEPDVLIRWPALDASIDYLRGKLQPQQLTVLERTRIGALLQKHGLHEADPEIRVLLTTNGEQAHFARIHAQITTIPAPDRPAEVIPFPVQRRGPGLR